MLDIKIGIIGFGEAGQNITEGLLSEDDFHIRAYDINFEKYKDIAKDMEVELYKDKNNFLNDLDLLFSLVPCSASILVIREFINLIEDKTIFVDLSASLPSYMEEGAELAGKYNKIFLDGAIMGSVTNFKHKVPIMLSGEYNKEIVKITDQLNMNIEFIGKKPAQASASKLCRSIYTKGTEALIVELKDITEHYNITDTVFNSIDKTWYLNGFRNEAERLLKSNEKHIQRKYEEIINVIDMIETSNLTAKMPIATKEVFKKKLNN
ncbi:MAG TPA: NAD(P)-binding domain-containing protein [Halanaerobiales bacterium]|nr:NAD(P)-binding domain-containing protein [Halanaerobiales bacterium]